jgi:DnaD/phage-associated family protein
MAVIRVEKTKNYTVMSNYHLRDKNLSLKAKGLLSFMLSLPDEWDYSVKGLVSCLKEGRDGIQAALMELEKYGYLKRERARTAGGKLSGAIYTVWEKPMTENPAQDNPAQEKPAQGNHTQINTNETSKEEVSKDNIAAAAAEADWQEVVTCYQNNIRPICGEIERDELYYFFSEYGKEWVKAGIAECVANDVRKRSYLRSILERWKSEGFKADGRRKKNSRPSKADRPLEDAFDKARADLERRLRDAGGNEDLRASG